MRPSNAFATVRVGGYLARARSKNERRTESYQRGRGTQGSDRQTNSQFLGVGSNSLHQCKPKCVLPFWRPLRTDSLRPWNAEHTMRESKSNLGITDNYGRPGLSEHDASAVKAGR